MKNDQMTAKVSDEKEKVKKSYEAPRVEEHDALDKSSACNSYSAAYVSGFGYYH